MAASVVPAHPLVPPLGAATAVGAADPPVAFMTIVSADCVARLVRAIDPPSIVLVTVPVSLVRTRPDESLRDVDAPPAAKKSVPAEAVESVATPPVTLILSSPVVRAPRLMAFAGALLAWVTT